MALSTTELRQQRAAIVAKMRELQDKLTEKGSESSEDGEAFAKMEKDIRSLEVIIEREEKLQDEEKKLAQSLDQSRRSGDPGKQWDGIHYPIEGRKQVSAAEIERRASYAVQGWLRAARSELKIEDEHLEAAKFFGFDLRQKEIQLPIIKNYRQFKAEQRDLQIKTATKGPELIPEGFVNSLEVALLAFGGMRDVSEVRRTDSGNDLPWPTSNDTDNEGELLSEATDFGSSVDASFGQVVFKAFKYSSKPQLVSSELLEDSAFDLGAQIGSNLGMRIGRIQNRHFTVGGGTTLPKGITIAASLGVHAASPTTFVGDEVVDLEHSVDPAYRTGGSWMFSDKVLAHIRKLKIASPGGSSDLQYIWQPGLQAGVPDRLLGYRYTINQHMSSTFAASERLMLFGDFMKYKIRDVATIRLRRLDELYAAKDQVAYIAYMRSDGNLVDAGTAPVRFLELAAS